MNRPLSPAPAPATIAIAADRSHRPGRVTFALAWSLVLGCLVATLTGCYGLGGQNISLGPLGYPLPVTAYQQFRAEQKFREHERYDRVPILGPTTSGGPPLAIDPPSDDEVMVAMERARPVQGGIPFLYEKQRNDVRIIKEKIADYVDPPRFYPLLGPAQLHHAHYKCTVYFDEKTIVGYPVPHTLHDEESIEVVYIDHNHFHMVGDVDPYTTPNL